MKKLFRNMLNLPKLDWFELPIEKRIFVSTNAIKRIL